MREDGIEPLVKASHKKRSRKSSPHDEDEGDESENSDEEPARKSSSDDEDKGDESENSDEKPDSPESDTPVLQVEIDPGMLAEVLTLPRGRRAKILIKNIGEASTGWVRYQAIRFVRLKRDRAA